MTGAQPVLMDLSEDELDTLVSIAIRRAEILAESQAPNANEAWYEVMIYEERLAALTRPEDVPGGIARVGAVTAALAAGRRDKALRLASSYLAEDSLSSERRAAIQRALKEEQIRARGDLHERIWRMPSLYPSVADRIDKQGISTDQHALAFVDYIRSRPRPAPQLPSSVLQPVRLQSQFGPDPMGRAH